MEIVSEAINLVKANLLQFTCAWRFPVLVATQSSIAVLSLSFSLFNWGIEDFGEISEAIAIFGRFLWKKLTVTAIRELFQLALLYYYRSDFKELVDSTVLSRWKFCFKYIENIFKICFISEKNRSSIRKSGSWLWSSAKRISSHQLHSWFLGQPV